MKDRLKMFFYPPQKMVCGKRASKMTVRPKEMLLSFSIGTFLTNYDVTIRKQEKALIYSSGVKTTFWEQKQVNGDYYLQCGYESNGKVGAGPKCS